MASEVAYDQLENAIGHRFKNRQFLQQALTHPSYTLQNKDEPHNQRLEFLGDAVIGLVLAEHLYASAPDEREGYLSRARAALVQGTTLSDIAGNFNLQEHLRLPEADARLKGAGDGMVEDALEAIAAAIYLDAGYEAARKAVLAWYGDVDKRLTKLLATLNPKGRLQEWLQAQGEGVLPQYDIIEETGPDHFKEFTAEVLIKGETMGRGVGRTKKDAEEEAAEKALIKLGE